jgi:adenylate kinase
MVIVLLGAPGAGKGTQAPILARHLGVPILASGDLLRAVVASGSDLGREVDATMRSGNLVADDTIVSIFLDRLGQADAAGGAILDGFPRTRAQAEALDRALASRGSRVDAALSIDVPADELIGRFADRRICRDGGHVYNLRSNPPRVPGICDIDGSELIQRADDAEATVRARMAQQLPALEEVAAHYRAGGRLRGVDGRLPIDVVSAALTATIDELRAGAATSRGGA